MTLKNGYLIPKQNPTCNMQMMDKLREHGKQTYRAQLHKLQSYSKKNPICGIETRMKHLHLRGLTSPVTLTLVSTNFEK